MLATWGTSTGRNPTLDLQFAGATSLDNRITFSRGTTATYFNSAGVLTTAGTSEARFDYNPSTLAAQGLLIEEQRTNLLLQSQDFATTWVATGTGPAVVTANTTTSLDGTVNADTVSGTATGSDRVQQTVTVAASTTYVISFFVKNSTSLQSRFHVANPNSGITNSDTYITWSGSAITGFINQGTTVGVAVAYPNNWWRVYFAFTTNASDAGTATVRFYPNTTAGDATYKAVFLWGAQLEAGAFPTSYIPTTTTALTRNADVASMTGTNFSSWYNASEGTLFTQAQDMSDATHSSAQPRVASINNGTNSTIDISRLSTSAQGRARIDDAGVNQFNSLVTAWPLATQAKIALAYKLNDAAACLGGTTVYTDNTVTIPTVNTLTIGNYVTGSTNAWTGWIQRISYYPVRLPNSTLQALTA